MYKTTQFNWDKILWQYDIHPIKPHMTQDYYLSVYFSLELVCVCVTGWKGNDGLAKKSLASEMKQEERKEAEDQKQEAHECSSTNKNNVKEAAQHKQEKDGVV